MLNEIIYVDKMLSMIKTDQFAPFVIEWKEGFSPERKRAYIVDRNNPIDINKDIDYVTTDAYLTDLLNRLVPMIEKYPYVCPLSGIKLDLEGFDFSFTDDGSVVEIQPVAYIEALRLLNIPEVIPSKTNLYLEQKRVSGGHLAKLQLTLEKESPLSSLSFQFFSPNPVELLSLVSEADINGASEPEEVNLAQLQMHRNQDTVTLLFGRPIFAKRLTFVLAQNVAMDNKDYVKSESESFDYQITKEDVSYLNTLMANQKFGFDVKNNEFITSDSNTQLAYQQWRKQLEERS